MGMDAELAQLIFSLAALKGDVFFIEGELIISYYSMKHNIASYTPPPAVPSAPKVMAWGPASQLGGRC